MYAIITNLGVVGAIRDTNTPIADIFTAVEIPAGATVNVGDPATEGADGVWTFPPAAAITKAQLLAYAGTKANALIAAIRPLSADGATIKSSATDAAIGKLAAMAAWGVANPSSTTIWTADDLSTVTVTGAQLAAISPLALAYSMSIYGAALPAVLADIAAGTITTTAQIDAYAWPI